MSKFIDMPSLSFVVLTAVVLAACDQGETQTKRPSGNKCPPRNVLAIVDVLRSEEQDRVFNDQIIDAAVKLASQCDAHLEVLHAYDWTAVYIQDMGVGALPLATGLYKTLGAAQRQAFAAPLESRGKR